MVYSVFLSCFCLLTRSMATFFTEKKTYTSKKRSNGDFSIHTLCIFGIHFEYALHSIVLTHCKNKHIKLEERPLPFTGIKQTILWLTFYKRQRSVRCGFFSEQYKLYKHKSNSQQMLTNLHATHFNPYLISCVNQQNCSQLKLAKNRVHAKSNWDFSNEKWKISIFQHIYLKCWLFRSSNSVLRYAGYTIQYRNRFYSSSLMNPLNWLWICYDPPHYGLQSKN